MSPQAKALIHEVEGAGRSRVLRPALGLTEAEVSTIANRIGRGIQLRWSRS